MMCLEVVNLSDWERVGKSLDLGGWQPEVVVGVGQAVTAPHIGSCELCSSE